MNENKPISQQGSDTGEPGTVAPQQATLAEPQDLQKELAKLKEQSQYHRDQWMRAAANLENYRKRVEKERGDLLRLGQSTLIAQLLPILDDLERAFLTLPAPLHGLTWTDGIALIERKVHLVLEQHGLLEIEALGKAFDPTVHQSIAEEETNQYPDGQIMAVLQKGYKFQNQVLRPAMVKVARNVSAAEQPAQVQTEKAPAEPKEDTA